MGAGQNGTGLCGTEHMGNTFVGSNDGLEAFVYGPRLEFAKVELPEIQLDRLNKREPLQDREVRPFGSQAGLT